MTDGEESEAVIVKLQLKGLVDAVGIERGRAQVRKQGGLLSAALLRLDLVREADFLRIFAELYPARFIKTEKLRSLHIDEGLLERVDVRSAERLQVAPLSWDQARQELEVVASVPLRPNLELDLRQLVGAKTIVVYVAASAAVSAAIRRAYYRQDDAFAEVTSDGAGPVNPASVAPSVDADHEGSVTAIIVSPELRVPPAQTSENKTVKVSLDALTIDTLRRENARYRIAQEFHKRVSLERNVDSMIDRILSVVFELLNADGAAVWLHTDRYASKSRKGDRQVEVPRTVIDQALVSTHGLLTNNALLDERFDRSASVMVRGVASVMRCRWLGRNHGHPYVEWCRRVLRQQGFAAVELHRHPGLHPA